MNYDFHAHVFTDKVAEKLIGKMEEIYGVKRRHNALVEELLPAARNGGIDRVVVLAIANRPEHVSFNKWYAELGKAHEAIIPFGSIHAENSPDELDSFPELGLRGFKIQPNAQRFFPDDRRMFPIYKRAEELGLIVVFHAGHEEGGVIGEFSQPDRFVPVIESHPNLRIVLSHFGGYKVWDKVDVVCGYPNVYFDTAHLPRNIDDGYFVELAEMLGHDRILFGTDFPFGDHKTEREYVERLFGAGLAKRFLSDNPERLLGLANH
jgi:uncharacterized protein